MVEESVEVEKRILTASDRCDADCTAAALVKVTGMSGDLYFCGHHYHKYENSENMKNFAYQIVDERWTIQNENRLKD